MSERENERHTLGWLLLRDGHAIPITGLEPADLKKARKRAVQSEAPLKHVTGLNAIVDTLGFDGDFGDYSRMHWPELQGFLRDHGCVQRIDAFATPLDAAMLSFNRYNGLSRQGLADRCFLGKQPPPPRVFLGVGVDWAAWYDRARATMPMPLALLHRERVVENHEAAMKLLLRGRLQLQGQWGFIDDKLFDGPLAHVVDKTYFTAGWPASERRESEVVVGNVVQAFRNVFDASDVGWMEILPFNERLAFLRAPSGDYDVIWKDLRDAPPPPPAEDAPAHGLHVMDVPSMFQQRADLERRLYFRTAVWREQEEHAAEQHFYDRGRNMVERRNTPSSEVVELYLRDRGRPTLIQPSAWQGEPPVGFTAVDVRGQRLLVSRLVTVAEFRRMLDETKYLARRDGDAWERANEGEPDDAPVGASWRDAQAYCAWMERRLRVSVRLLGFEEHRAIRPLASRHYEKLAQQDFPWEEWPPREIGGVTPASAVRWSEPRFEEAGGEVSEFPGDDGFGTGGRKRWISDFPPFARWVSEIPWARYHGLDVIDAWDAFEWCQEPGWISGRYWEGGIAADCWGAYKNVKVGFRVVVMAG
jgi:hypothetical protein